MVSPHILRTCILILSWPWALFQLRLTKIFSILSAVKLVVRNLLSPRNLGFVEGLLQFFSKEHWLEKKELKKFRLFFEKC